MIACTYIILSAHSFAKFYGHKNVMGGETAKFKGTENIGIYSISVACSILLVVDKSLVLVVEDIYVVKSITFELSRALSCSIL